MNTALNTALTAENLTEKEQLLLAAIFKNAPYNNLKSLLVDNFSWFSHKDFKNDYSRHEFAGLVSALSEKSIVATNEDGADLNDCWLSAMFEKYGNITW